MLRRLQKKAEELGCRREGIQINALCATACEWQEASVIIVRLGNHCSISRALELQRKHLSRDAENEDKHYWDPSADKWRSGTTESGPLGFLFLVHMSTTDQGDYEPSTSHKKGD